MSSELARLRAPSWGSAVPAGFRPERLSEKEQAIILANKILDRPSVDPDGNLAVLSRQLLRALERLGEYKPPEDAS